MPNLEKSIISSFNFLINHRFCDLLIYGINNYHVMNEVFVMKNIFLLKKQNAKRVIMHS